MNDQKIKKKQGSKERGILKAHQPKPVIIELDEVHDHTNESKNNDLLIKKMIKSNNSSLKFSGGYKSNINASNVSAHQSNIGKSAFQAENEQHPQQYKINVGNQSKSYNVNVYNELGVTKNKPKYRIDQNSSQNINNQSYSMKQLQSKIQLLKKDRQYRNNSLFQQPGDVYIMADNKDRFQSVIHAKSSLDTITLQNIEAKLQAHRRNMKQIQEQYNAKKGKMAPIDRYGYMKVNIDVDKQYAQLQVDNDKIYQIAKKRQQMEPDQIQFEELWEMKKRNDPKLREYDAKYREYLVTKGAKNLIGAVVRDNLYTWDKYKQPGHQHSKSRPKNPMDRSQSPRRLRSPQKDPHQSHMYQNQSKITKNDIAENYEVNASTIKYGPDGLVSIRDIKDVIAKKDDKFIASYIFAQIDTGKVGFVSKEELHDYLLKQEHIINGYNIDTKWLYTDLDNFQTKRKGMLNRIQLATFLATIEKLQHPKLSLTNKSNNFSQLGKTSTLAEGFQSSANKQIQSRFQKFKPVFQKLFNALDFNDDKIIKRVEFIQNIYVDSQCINILDEDVIRIKTIDKSITVRQIIGFILDDYDKERNEKLKRAKQYITFTRFCQYFNIPQSLDLTKIDKSSLKRKQDSSTEYQIFDLPQQYLLLLKDIFNQIPRIYQDYIVSADFVQAALRDPQILALSDQLCRIQSIETRLPLQSLQTTLHRMQKQCDQYSTWEGLKAFFSRRGRPLDWDYQLIMKKKQIRNSKLKEQRNNLSKSKMRQTQNYFRYSDDLRNKSKQRLKKIPDKYTVPQPFDITDMKQKPDVEQAKKGQKQFEQLKKQFKAIPVNKQILEPKPDLIAGKIKKQASKSNQNKYKYEDYQNDRIQRALKKAQQQYQIQQKLRQFKQRTQIKATEIGIDLTKKYIDVIKQQKKKRQNSKFKPTQPKASQSLYPKDPKNQKAKKIDKVKQNIQKADQVLKRKNQMLEQDKNKVKQKNQQIRKMAQQAKKREKEQQRKRDQVALDGLDFKPKIKKRQITDKQKQQIQKGRIERQKKKQQQQIERLRAIQQHKKKILSYDKKQAFLQLDKLENDEQILQNIDLINFQELLLDQKSKKQYQKQFDNRNKTIKQLKQRQSGLAGRQRAAMQEQQRRIMQQKRKYKQAVQKKKTDPKSGENYSGVSAKGEGAAFKEDLNFHRSRALRRYRALMDNKKPDSDFDRYSIFNRTQKGETNNMLAQLQQQQQQDGIELKEDKKSQNKKEKKVLSRLESKKQTKKEQKQAQQQEEQGGQDQNQQNNQKNEQIDQQNQQEEENYYQSNQQQQQQQT